MRDEQVERNLKGIELEKFGNVDEAMSLYEQNVSEKFGGSHPYMRLAIIYRRRGQINDEIRILDRAVSLYEKEFKEGIGCSSDLEKFSKRLEKANKLKQRKGKGES